MNLNYAYAALRCQAALECAKAAGRKEPSDADLAAADERIDQMSNTNLIRSLLKYDMSTS